MACFLVYAVSVSWVLCFDINRIDRNEKNIVNESMFVADVDMKVLDDDYLLEKYGHIATINFSSLKNIFFYVVYETDCPL